MDSLPSSSSPVNWEALDALIIEFAESENLIEDTSLPSSSFSFPSSSPSSYSSSSYQSRLLFRQIRRSLQIGDIDSAIDLLRLHAPSVLDDHRLFFRLQKQKFIELLRRGTEQDRDSAIDCLRTALAPSALDAYPDVLGSKEAYEEFKHVLLAFIYGQDDQTSPVVNEWSERRLFELAGLMTSVLRAHLHAYDPVFSMTVRYLISIHKGFCFRLGISSPISDLTERLLLEERDPPATLQESYFEAPPFNEVDIQALAHAVELTRQGAVDSLKFAKGDLFQAFQNELCRMRLDVTMLDDLIHEYCVYSGIANCGPANPSSQGMRLVRSHIGLEGERSLSYKMDPGLNGFFQQMFGNEINWEAVMIANEPVIVLPLNAVQPGGNMSNPNPPNEQQQDDARSEIYIDDDALPPVILSEPTYDRLMNKLQFQEFRGDLR